MPLISCFPYIIIKPSMLVNVKCTYLTPLPNMKQLKNLSNICFENEYVNFLKKTRNLGDSKIINSFSKSTINHFMSMMTYKLTSPFFTIVFNFNKSVKNLDLDTLLIKRHALLWKGSHSPFAHTFLKDILTRDLQIIMKDNLWLKTLNM